MKGDKQVSEFGSNVLASEEYHGLQHRCKDPCIKDLIGKGVVSVLQLEHMSDAEFAAFEYNIKDKDVKRLLNSGTHVSVQMLCSKDLTTPIGDLYSCGAQDPKSEIVLTGIADAFAVMQLEPELSGEESNV